MGSLTVVGIYRNETAIACCGSCLVSGDQMHGSICAINTKGRDATYRLGSKGEETEAALVGKY